MNSEALRGARRTLAHEHLSLFVVTKIGDDDQQPTLRRQVHGALRRQMEKPD